MTDKEIIEQLRKALEYYADPEVYRVIGPNIQVLFDHGKVAIAALDSVKTNETA